MMTPITKQITIDGIDAQTLFAMFERLEQHISEVHKASPSGEGGDGLLTRAEAAKLIGVSMPTLHSYLKKGIIKSSRIGRNVRIRKSDIDAALLPIKHYKR